VSDDRQQLLHNMSAPPKSTLHVAPGRTRRQTAVAALGDLLPKDGPDFPARLAARLGLGDGLESTEALNRLEEATARALDAHQVPVAAVVVLPTRDGPRLPALLSVALLSRCSGRLMLRERSPLFTHERLANARVGFVDPRLLGVAR
jgi:hypothetical protein